MLARLQQAIVFGLGLSTVLWVVGCLATGHPAAAIAAPASLVGGYALALALEFGWLWRSYEPADQERPRAGRLVSAWLRELAIGPQVFLWAQPFRSRRFADSVSSNSRRGVVLVHGFFCNRGFWNPWMRAFDAASVSFVAVDLEPVLGSIDGYAETIERAVARIEVATGRAPIVVAHSMGGLAVRAWLHRLGAVDRCHHVVTIGTPHAGTWLGRFARSLNGREMRLGSDWLAALREAEADARRARVTCWWSDCDNIVFPTRGATLPHADNRMAPGLPHVALAFHPPILEHVLRLVDEA